MRLLVIALLIATVVCAGGLAVSSYRVTHDNIPNYKLTLHVRNWIDGTPGKFLPIEVIQKVDSEENTIAAGQTDKNGVVTFLLAQGKYECRVAPEATSGKGVFGTTTIVLTEDTETKLNVEWIPIK